MPKDVLRCYTGKKIGFVGLGISNMPVVKRKANCSQKNAECPVSRVLSCAIIYLVRALPHGSVPPMELSSRRDAPYAVLLRIGFTWRNSLLPVGELLPRLSILT